MPLCPDQVFASGSPGCCPSSKLFMKGPFSTMKEMGQGLSEIHWVPVSFLLPSSQLPSALCCPLSDCRVRILVCPCFMSKAVLFRQSEEGESSSTLKRECSTSSGRNREGPIQWKRCTWGCAEKHQFQCSFSFHFSPWDSPVGNLCDRCAVLCFCLTLMGGSFILRRKRLLALEALLCKM